MVEYSRDHRVHSWLRRHRRCGRRSLSLRFGTNEGSDRGIFLFRRCGAPPGLTPTGSAPMHALDLRRGLVLRRKLLPPFFAAVRRLDASSRTELLVHVRRRTPLL